MSGSDDSAEVDAKLASLADWRGERLAQIRAMIRDADPDVIETMKYRKPSNPAGVPFWEDAGILCSGEAFRDKVKLTFAHGAALPDPAGLFNNGLGGNKWRAIDLREGDKLDEAAFKALIRAAVAHNRSAKAAKTAKRS